MRDGFTLTSWKCKNSTGPIPSAIRESGTRSAMDSRNSTSWLRALLHVIHVTGVHFVDGEEQTLQAA